MNTLTVMEEERIRAALDDLRRSDTPTNWYRYRHSMTTSLVDSHRYSSVIQVVVCIRIQERDRARWRWRGYVDDARADGDGGRWRRSASHASTPGGLDELKTQLGSNDIRYAVLEALVTGDDYNAVKYVLITWIGPDVSAGTSLPPSPG